MHSDSQRTPSSLSNIRKLALHAPLWLSAFCGCSIFTESQSARVGDDGTAAHVKLASDTLPANAKIANPPARTIRFDGHEIVLGDADAGELTADKFLSTIGPLVNEGRMRSAAALVNQVRETGERIMAERWATSPNDPTVRLISQILSERTTDRQSDWNSLLSIAKNTT